MAQKPGEPLRATYLMPIRRTVGSSIDELSAYLRDIAAMCDEVIVVDGSDVGAFGEAHREWSALVTHVAPDPAISGLNGKVRGVLTGVDLARNERIVIADDDVRYDADALARTVDALDDADLARPQNYFAPMPWHAVWDTARTLLNRAGNGVDFPGTLAVRRTAVRRRGGYCADVLFENLELIRTVQAAGGRVVSPPDLYVRRLPPSASRFWSQRVRQAYDEFARPWRLLGFLAVVPATVGVLRRGRVAPVMVAMLTTVALAESGRRRAGGTSVFPFAASLCAPVWVLERSVCSWLALAQRLTGGCRYAGVRIRAAATPVRKLRAA